ncbi:hypothetical protein EDC96DRAFT_507352 [Choanephora cucurbitarum]|nr:hypothetical protein EDC96DRAFT_507352 [Choanephora cucurbitarum]
MCLSPLSSCKLHYTLAIPTHSSCIKKLIHMCLHQWNPYYSQASYKIDLQQEHTPSKWRLLKRSSPFSLSLISPVDFTWSLESKERVFYFQTRQIKRSQAWYRTIYQSLPPSSKHALPRFIDLNLPELNLTIQLPLSDSEANIDLKSVRDSALALLNQYQHRPPSWNKKTVGVCWRYQPLDSLHWEVIPYGDHNTTYLIGPQLIEGPYTLELRQWTPSSSIPSPFLEGYLMQQDRRMLYAKSVGHYLFLYQLKKPKRRYRFLRKRKTAPSDYASIPDALIGMADLSETKQEFMRFNQQTYTFQSLPHTVHASYTTLVVSGLSLSNNLSLIALCI